MRAARTSVPPEVARQLAEATRELLLALRALIDWWIARLEREPEAPVEVPAPVADDPAAALQPEQNFDLNRPLREARDAFEKSYCEFHLAQENGSMTRVAEKTGLERTHLYRKLKQLGVDLTRNKRLA